jgi:hypothetical protein
MEQWSYPDPGSGIKHPGSATLPVPVTYTFLCLGGMRSKSEIGGRAAAPSAAASSCRPAGGGGGVGRHGQGPLGGAAAGSRKRYSNEDLDGKDFP